MLALVSSPPLTLSGSDDRAYTYTIITTDSNKQLKFLHDRMPAILDSGSDDMRVWLDPSRHGWSRELQTLLRPFRGELEVYPVSKDVGKVGNDSPSFLIPVDSKENKSNIANFFAPVASTREGKPVGARNEGQQIFSKQHHDCPAEEGQAKTGHETPPGKRKASVTSHTSPLGKKQALGSKKRESTSICPTQNTLKSPSKRASPGSQKITKFFGSST